MGNNSRYKKILVLVVIFVFVTKTAFSHDTEVVLAETYSKKSKENDKNNLTLDTPPFEPLASSREEYNISTQIAFRNILTTGSDKISEKVFVLGEKTVGAYNNVATVGGAINNTAQKFYCTVSGWFGVGCKVEKVEPPAPIIVEKKPVINVVNNITKPTTVLTTAPVTKQTIIVNGITLAELEARLALFRSTLNTSSSDGSARDVNGSRISVDRIYDSIGESSDEAAEDAVTGGSFSFSGIDGTFSGNVSVAGTLNVAGTTTLGGAVVAGGDTGTNGYVLQTTGTGVQWVATSSLGIVGGGGGGTWGSITGTLSSQTDLQNALDTKQDSFATGTSAQYFKGDLTLGTFPTTTSAFANDSDYVSTSTINSLESINIGCGNIGGSATFCRSAIGYANCACGSGASAFGYNNLASGNTSVAMGYSSCSTAIRASAFGYGSIASGCRSTAVGYVNTASGCRSTASGYVNQATGKFSSALGFGNSASADYSSASGANNVASACFASTFGACNIAMGVYSSAFGYYNTASGCCSTALGHTVCSVGCLSSAFGTCITNATAQSVMIGPSQGKTIHILNTGEVQMPFITATSTSATSTLTNTCITGVLSVGGTAGTSGYVLQTTGTGVQWVATSSLGIVGGGGIWGSITGTLSAQTDLQNELDAKLSTTTAASTYVPTSRTLNGLALSSNQSFATGTTGTDFGITSTGTTHTFNLPTASGTNRGLLSSADWTTFSNKGTGTVTAVSVASANGFTGTSSGGATPALTLGTSITGLLKGNGTAISAASAGSDYEVPLTFSTGLVRTGDTITANTTQNIAKLSNLTTNGFLKTSASDGTLCVDTTTYLSCLNNLSTIAVGNLNSAAGSYSSAFGACNCAIGVCSITGGYMNCANCRFSTAVGSFNNTSGYDATAVGYCNLVSGSKASAFGYCNCSSGFNSNTSGYLNIASGDRSSAIGYFNNSSGYYTSAFGYRNAVCGTCSSSFGHCNNVSGDSAVAIGSNITNSTNQSVEIGICDTEKIRITAGCVNFITASGGFYVNGIPIGSGGGGGLTNSASGYCSISLGCGLTDAIGNCSSAFGYNNCACGGCSFVAGACNIAYCDGGVAVGYWNNSCGQSAVAIGTYSCALNSDTVAIGFQNGALGARSSAVGYSNCACGPFSLSSGYCNNSSGYYSTASGAYNTSGACCSAAFGTCNDAGGTKASAFGNDNTASGYHSSAIGSTNIANCFSSSAIGFNNCASVDYASSFGYRNNACGCNSSAFGYCNTTDILDSSSFGYRNFSGYRSTAVGYCNCSLSCATAIGANMYNCVDKSTIIGTGSAYCNDAAIHICCTGSGAASIQFCGYGTGTLTTNAFGVITASSDERLKNISGEYTLGLANIIQVNPISYTWKDGTGLEDGKEYSGFSAQNLQTAIPQAVTTGPNGYLNIQDRPIIAASVNAIKELNSLSLLGITSLQTNTEKLDALISLVGTDGVSTSTRALFDKLDLDVADLATLTSENSDEIIGLKSQFEIIGEKIDGLVTLVESFGASVVDGVLHFGEVVFKKVKTEELCLDDVCITKDQLQKLLDNANLDADENTLPPTSETASDPIIDGTSTEPIIAATSTDETEGGGEMPNPDPIIEPTPEPVVEPTSDPVMEPTPVPEPALEPAPAEPVSAPETQPEAPAEPAV